MGDVEPNGKGFGWVESYPIRWLVSRLEQAESTQAGSSVVDCIRKHVLQALSSLRRCSRSREGIQDTAGCLVQYHHAGGTGGVKDQFVGIREWGAVEVGWKLPGGIYRKRCLGWCQACAQTGAGLFYLTRLFHNPKPTS
jgi:hypothetical protein